MTRISRGFHRLGVVLAAPAAFAAIILAFWGYQERNTDLAIGTHRAKQVSIFEVQDTDGSLYKVQAPDAQAAVSIFKKIKGTDSSKIPPLPPGFALTEDTNPFDQFDAKPWGKYPASDASGASIKPMAHYFGTPLLAAALALATYLSMVAIGWVVSGFVRNQDGAA